MATVTMYFDCISSASYIAWTQMPRLAEETGATIDYRPMLLGGLFKATGNAPPINVPAKAAYLARDFKRCAERLGIPFNQSEHLFSSTAGIMRMVLGVQRSQPERFRPLVSAFFETIFVLGHDVADPVVVSAAITRAGLDPAALTPYASDPELKDLLRKNTDEAAARGAFGAPTFFVGDEMFFGQDRLDFVREALQV